MNEVLNPTESKQYPGYYHHPVYQWMVINKLGSIINTITGTVHKFNPDSAGYLQAVIRKDGKCKSYLQHRLLARTFIGRPERHLDKSFDDLEVNHKDCIKTNNALDNLEWVTPKENIEHSKNNWCKSDYIIPVLARDIRTGAVRKFYSQRDCSTEFGLAPTRFGRHLSSDKRGLLTKNWHVFKLDDGTEWPHIPEDSIDESTWDSLYSVWIVENTITNKKYIFANEKQIVEMMPELGTAGGIRNAIARRKQYIKDNWLVRRKDIPTTEEKEMAGERHTRIFKPAQTVIVTNLNTGHVQKFNSIRKVGPALGFNKSWAHVALKKENGISDGYKVEYLTK